MTASERAPLISRRQWPLGAEALRDNGVLALRDGSSRARFGCKGREAPSWLGSRGFRVPDAANSATVDERGILVARLATSEFLIEALGAPDDDAVAEVTRELVSSPPPPGVYPVLRQDVVIELSGTGLNSLLRQIC